jgi:hypothetical protein
LAFLSLTQARLTAAVIPAIRTAIEKVTHFLLGFINLDFGFIMLGQAKKKKNKELLNIH